MCSLLLSTCSWVAKNLQWPTERSRSEALRVEGVVSGDASENQYLLSRRNSSWVGGDVKATRRLTIHHVPSPHGRTELCRSVNDEQ